MAHTEHHKTFRIKAPLETHFRRPTPEDIATGRACRSAGCPDYERGWRLRWDVLSEPDRHLATHSGRAYRLESVSELENWLVFEAGQPCFRASTHLVRLDVPEIFVVRDGRNTPRVHSRPEDFTEDMQEHTDRVVTARERG